MKAKPLRNYIKKKKKNYRALENQGEM
jgi:hypothetical protein